MGRFEPDARKLLDDVGGKENISAVSHCVTRMRFVLKDPAKAKVKDIEDLDSVKGSFTQAGQFQVIIGNEVDQFYNDFAKISGLSGVSKAEAKVAAKDNQSPLQKAMSTLAEIFAPIIPAIVVGGILLGLRNVIGDLPLDALGGKKIAEISQFWAGTYDFLWLICEAVFHMLPVMITWSVVKKMGGTEALGIVLGLCLVSGQLLNAYGVASAKEIPFWDFGFATINKIGYQAQVLPAIFAGLCFVYLERFWKRVIPNAIAMVFVPLLSLVPTVLLAHVLLGPVGWKIGSWIADIVYAGLTSTFRWLFGGVFGTFYSPLVITGLHHMTNAIDLQLMQQFNGTILWPMIALSNIAQGSSTLAIYFANRKDAKVSSVSLPSAISAYLGVTEPAMFGVNIKYRYPFVCAMIGSGIACLLSVLMNVQSFGIGVGGIPGILSIQPVYYLKFALCMAIAIVVPFVLTTLMQKRKGSTENA